MNKNIVFIFILLTFAILISVGCTAKKNTVVAMNEGLVERYQWEVDVSKNSDGRTQDANISSAIMLKFANDDLISSSRINVD
ncbi:MAG TPA: hypothetical protein VH815_15110, partial [Acidobacteriota bacterium]